MYESNLFKGKKVLVSGGRSGIGYAIAKQYLQLGADVCIVSRKEDKLIEAAKSLSEFGNCISHTCDIRDLENIDQVVNFIKSEWGTLDILINNAGGQFASPAKLMKPKGWNAVINNNLNGTFYMCQSFGNAFFIPQESGVILNIIVNFFRGFPAMSHTSAARAGVDNLTKSLSQEWARYNIRVNAVAPGIIESSGLDEYPPPIQDLMEKTRDMQLFGRFGTVEEVSNAVMFLTSPLSSYTSGVTLAVDGTDHLSLNSMYMYDTLMKLMGE